MKKFKSKLTIGMICAMAFSSILFCIPPEKDRECKDCNGYNWTCVGAERCDAANYLECSECDFKCGYYVGGTIIWGELHNCNKVM
jgi:hypothetical protein